MENDHERDVTASVPADEARAEDITTAEASDRIADRQARKLNEYLEESLDKKDPLQACLNAVNADLMMISFKFGSAIRSAMGAMPTELADYADLMSSIDCVLRVNKQIDRFSQLDLRLTSAKASLAAVALPTTALGKQSGESAT